MCISVFFVMLGVGIVGPILPLYAAAFTVSYSLVGMVISSFGLARAFVDVPAGWLTDRWGRKPLILIGMAIFGVAALLAAFAGNIYHLILSRFVQGIGAALLTTAAMALVSDIAPPSRRGTYMSYYQGSFFLGTTFGPAIGGFLAEIGGFQIPFFALAGLSLAGVIFAHIMISESLPRAKQSEFSFTELGNALKGMLSNRKMLVLGYSAASLFILTAGIRLTAIPLYGERIAMLSPAEIGIVLSVAAFSSFITLTWSGSMVDKYGAKPLLVGAFLMAAVSSYAFILCADLLAMSLVAVVLGFGAGMANPAQASAVIGEADPKHRGLTLGGYRVFGDIGVILGPLIAGALSDHFGLLMPFVGIALLCVLTSAVTYLVLE